MTTARTTRPPRLPASLADVLEPELPALADEIVGVIGSEIEEYTRPLEGAFGRAVRTGVSEALSRFVRLIRAPGSGAGVGEATYFALGREEHRAGRTLDSLQSAYRIGARVAWRRFALACRAAHVDEETLALLAESIFAYIDELSAESIEGYTQAQMAQADERQRARSRLVETLIGLSAPGVEIAPLAAAADWRTPRRAAALATGHDELGGVVRRLGPDALGATVRDVGCVIVPDPDGPGRAAAVRRAIGDRRAAFGPPGAVQQLPRSWLLATRALALAPDGALAEVDAHLADLLLIGSAPVVERISELRLAPLDDLGASAQARMRDTALAYVQNGGNATAIARALNIHPQTARYRTAQLRKLLGDQLDDPAARLELEAALRHRSRLAAAS